VQLHDLDSTSTSGVRGEILEIFDQWIAAGLIGP